jgi:hypothetical protein
MEFISRWNELKAHVRPCTNREDELALHQRPYCDDCGVRMGSPGHDNEVDTQVAAIEQMLTACSVRLSEIAVSRVLSGQREEELRKLISMNALADLTSMSHILDSGVMTFLHRFAGDTPADHTQGRAE